MALQKEIIQEDGVTTNYHRILLIQSTINVGISISVLSYLSAESRATETPEVRPYKTGVTYCTDYVENMTIEDAYEYLKTLPEFEGAIDI